MKFAADQKEHTFREAVSALATIFRLTDEEQRKTYSSGRQRIFDNKVGWAISNLKHAGLIESTKRGSFRITHEGLKVLDENPTRIDNKLLMRYPHFVEYIRGGRKKDDTSQPQVESGDETPDEILRDAYLKIESKLAGEILELVLQRDSDFFEELVKDLVVAMGYGGSKENAVEKIGRTGDEGIDAIIRQDLLGLDQIHIQAKRWQGTVGRPEIQKFVGALEGQGTKKGIFITTGSFSADAEEYVKKIGSKIKLIDGPELAKLMIKHNVGVSPKDKYEIKEIDGDYFEL